MKNLKKVFSLLVLASLMACSSDENDALDDVNNNFESSNVEIKVNAITEPDESRFVTENDNLIIDSFMVNIARIEFEFADGFGNGISSPSIDDMGLSFNQLPQPIKDYLAANYPNDPFCKAEMEDDNDDPYLYEVELLSGTELYFTEDFDLFAVETDDDGCDASDDDDNDNSDDDDYKIFGPFELDVVGEPTVIANIDIPVAEYEEVEFEMQTSSDSSSPLFQRSMLMTGTLNGIPFEFYHIFSEDFEVDYEDAGQNLVITNDNNNEVTFQFDLVSVINAVNFDAATDGNGDGTIEISPVDSDGNSALANQIKNAIKQYVELMD